MKKKQDPLWSCFGLFEEVPEDSPFCGCGRIAKNGRRPDGVQKYSCRGCGRSFNPLTGTLFGSRKIPLSEWVEQ